MGRVQPVQSPRVWFSEPELRRGDRRTDHVDRRRQPLDAVLVEVQFLSFTVGRHGQTGSRRHGWTRERWQRSQLRYAGIVITSRKSPRSVRELAVVFGHGDQLLAGVSAHALIRRHPDSRGVTSWRWLLPRLGWLLLWPTRSRPLLRREDGSGQPRRARHVDAGDGGAQAVAFGRDRHRGTTAAAARAAARSGLGRAPEPEARALVRRRTSSSRCQARSSSAGR